MMEDEHEVYGGDIPEEVEGELEGELDGQPENGSIKADDVVGDDAASKVYMSFPSWFIYICVWFPSVLLSGLWFLVFKP